MRDGTATKRWFIDFGADLHYYLIPVVRRAEWDDWIAMRGVHADRELDAPVPDFCRLIMGLVSEIEFSYPENPNHAETQR